MLRSGACDTSFYGRDFCREWKQKLDSVPVHPDTALDLEKSGMDSIWLGAFEVLKPCASDFSLYGQSPCEQLRQNMKSRFVVSEELDLSPHAAFFVGRKTPPLTRDAFDHEIGANPFPADINGRPTKTLPVPDYTIGPDGLYHPVTTTSNIDFSLGPDGQLHFVTSTSNLPLFTTDKHGNPVPIRTTRPAAKAAVTTLPRKSFTLPLVMPTRTRLLPQLPAWMTRLIAPAAPTTTLQVGHQELR